MSSQPDEKPAGKLSAALAGRPAGEPTAFEVFRVMLERMRPQIALLCGKDNVDKFLRVCQNAVQANPDVLLADRRSLLIACLRAAQDNILPDGREGVLNIFNTKVKVGNDEKWVKMVQYMPMAYGLIQKIYEAGATYVDAVAVFEKDEFDYQRGDDPKIVHKPYSGEDNTDKVVASYVVVKMKTGEVKREVMFRRDIEKVRDKSKAKSGMMWNDFYDQGAIKSVIHRVSKQLPRAESLSRALAHDRDVTGLAGGVEDAVITGDAQGTSVESLIDSRMATELRDQALRDRAANRTTENVTGATGAEKKEEKKDERREPPKGDTKTGGGGGTSGGKPGGKGTPEKKAELIERMKVAADVDALGDIAVEADTYEWADGERGEINNAYFARQTALGG